jgi:hypothetical protein
MELDVQKSNESVYIVTCKNLNCPWRLYARALATSTWEVSMNPFQHTCYGHAIKTNHCEMTIRIITGLIKPRLRDNLNINHITQEVW